MGSRSVLAENVSTVRELVLFMWHGRTWWLTPIVIVLVLISLVLFFVEGSAVAPFIYTMF